MRILLTGKTGQVGYELERTLAVVGEVRALGRADCDLADGAAIAACVGEFRPEVIVNAAAYTAVDAAETSAEAAFAINGNAPGVMGESAKKLGALVVHFSTDYVFDGGADRPYVETDETNPLGVYGNSKLAGERNLAASGARHVIFRTSWVVGVIGANFAKTMLRLAKERESIRVVADQWGAPTTAALLADVTAHVVARREVPSGTFHVTASGETTWWQYAKDVIDYADRAGVQLKASSSAVVPIATSEYATAARRPQNSRLNTDKFQATFGLRLPPWQACLQHTLRLIVNP